MKKTLCTIIVAMIFTSASASAFAVQINDPAPTFALRDSSGNNFYLSDYLNGKKKENVKGIVISFFASWCKPCRNELPVLNALVDVFKSKGIMIVIIGYNEDFDKIGNMLAELKVNKPLVLSDKYGKVAAKYMVRSLPMTFFIGRDGQVKDIIHGELPNIENELRNKADRLLL